MRVLILGGDGMLGHQLLKSFKGRHEVRVTLRKGLDAYGSFGLFKVENAYGGIDVRALESVTEVFADFRPQAVVNAAGIVKQRSSAHEIIPTLEINALLPHRLAILCKAIGARLVHISTDCIFSGRKGSYQEDDKPDAEDLYGKSKYLGEVREPHCVTLRTSIIGRELSRKTGLLEWYLAQQSSVRGFRRAIFSGFTTLEMARIIEKVLLEKPTAYGVYQVSSDRISKYELLLLIRRILGYGATVLPDDSVECDRSLDSGRFRSEFAYSPPSWETMIEELRPTQ